MEIQAFYCVVNISGNPVKRSIETRENLGNREGQTDYTPVDKYQFTWTSKGVRC